TGRWPTRCSSASTRWRPTSSGSTASLAFARAPNWLRGSHPTPQDPDPRICQTAARYPCSRKERPKEGAVGEIRGVEHWVAEEFERNVVGPIEDFQDPSQEWRRLFSEVLGTFFLVLVAAGGGMMNQAFGGAIGRAAAVTAPGLMVLAIILFMGKISGAHLNPAVSLAFAARGNFPWVRVP